jgi:hypothetical protein
MKLAQSEDCDLCLLVGAISFSRFQAPLRGRLRLPALRKGVRNLLTRHPPPTHFDPGGKVEHPPCFLVVKS